MRLLYSIFVAIYSKLILVAACFNQQAGKWIRGRKNWEHTLLQKTGGNSFFIWIHCASAGEFEQAIPLIQEIKKSENHKNIAISFFSPSGYELYKDSAAADLFFYLPIDTTENATKLIDLLKPECVLFIRNEIWWNILIALKEKNIPVYLVNAHLNQKRNFLYHYYLQQTYPLFTKIFDVEKYGDTKQERVLQNKALDFKDSVLETFCKDSTTIIVGSSWADEEKMIAEFYKKHNSNIPNLKIIIAPHEFDKNKQADLELLFETKITTYTQQQQSNTESSLLFLDKKGILKYIYRFAGIAIIGGGFNKAVHNISEAAVYGIPTISGPNYHKFKEAEELINLQVAFPVNNYQELETKLLELINSTASKNHIREQLDDYFSKQLQTSKKIITEILK